MKTLVTGALQTTEEDLLALQAAGLEITIHPDERTPVQAPERYEAVICNGLFLYQNIELFHNLKYIQLTSAGYDRVPLDYIRQHGISLHNAAGVYSIPMAEWTILRILELYKHSACLHENQQNRRWKKNRSWTELSGKTACIIGYGAYGHETAKRLKAFGVTVQVVNRTNKQSPFIDAVHPLTALPAVLPRADIVILAIALTPETQHLIGAKELAQLKPGAILINAARGALIDEVSLIHALEHGPLLGAALDVFEIEPLPETSRLWDLPNVLLSPHNSFVGEQTHHRLMSIILDHLAPELTT